jgi:hypothetical protein
MKTTEAIFRESIDQYKILINNASALSKIIADLAPAEILRCCKTLQKQQRKQGEVDKFIIEIMLDSGPRILETPYIGEYQRVLDKAMQACDEVALKAKAIRTTLQPERPNIHYSQKNSADKKKHFR